jgi:hypothetical protein
MNASTTIPSSQSKVLRRLYLTLFLRGRSARGLSQKNGSKSIAMRLGLTLFFYAMFGCFALAMLGQPLFSLSLYLHGVSLFFVGMFVAASSGEVLFNQDEAEILLHRPVWPRAMLWAKVSVLLQVSLLLSLAFNLAGMLGGSWSRNGSALFIPAHVFSCLVSALFCTGSVVLVYQLCLRWFGRERLDGLMTLAQIIMTLVLVTSGQFAPRMMEFLPGEIRLGMDTWWLALLPPAWFAALDVTLVGRGDPTMWALAAMGLLVTAGVLALAFGKLAASYESGLRALGEMQTRKAAAPGQGRWIQRLVALPLLSGWLRHPVERAGFLLTGSYMLRDRDVKLRLYPGLVPMLVMPVIMLANSMRDRDGGALMLLLGGCYIPLIPMLALHLLRFSQHWQAADVFLITPSRGPGRLITGARKAVEVFLVLPSLLVMGAAVVWITGGFSGLIHLLPGMLALPVYSRMPCMGRTGLPLSLPADDAKSAGRGLLFMGAMLSAMALGGMAAAARAYGYLTAFLVIEAAVSCLCAVLMDRSIRNMPWAPIKDAGVPA